MYLHCDDFNLKHTLESGQFFRYYTKHKWYYVITQDQFFRIRQENSVLECDGSSRKFVSNFFGLNDGFEMVKKSIARDASVRNAMRIYAGLRILHQDPWEALVAFLCSSASNIPKITKNVNLLAEKFGRRTHLDDETAYTFPKVGEIHDVSVIKACATGFRAKYIFAANRLRNYFFEGIKKDGYTQALNKLIQLDGVGEKIADCVLLFGFHRLEAFPVDVWIKRVMEELYFDNEEVTHAVVKTFAQKKFGKFAGYANQYLYHWRRNV